MVAKSSRQRWDRPRRALLAWSAVLLLTPTMAAARPGDLAEPLAVPAFPFVHASSTVGREPAIARYDCAPSTSEGGPEVVYTVAIEVPGRITAWVEGDDGTVDIDVQILDRLDVALDGMAPGCLDRDNTVAEAPVEAGEWVVVVDTYLREEQAGPYRLRLDFQPDDAWYERPVAQGVTVATRPYADLFGGHQTGSVLRVDLDAAGVSVAPIDADGCQRTSVLGAEAGAVAAINGGFFGTAGGCPSVSLIKIDGQLLATNATTRTAFGIDADGEPMLTLVTAGQDWPAAVDALGGVPRLASGGAIDVRSAEENAGSGFTTQRHPRTAVGITAAGDLVLATADGRTSAGLGMSLAELAQWMIWLGADEALNLDGGGSTAMWVAGEPWNGVVSYPSDDGQADHDGERAVGSALGVFAPPLQRPVAWLTAPPDAPAREGEAWVFEVVAADPDGGLAELELGPAPALAGALDLAARADGTARLTYTPRWPDGRDGDVRLEVEAFVDGAADGGLSFEVAVVWADGDGDGLPDGWEIDVGLDPGRDDAAEDPDGDGATNAEEYVAGTDPRVDDDPEPGDDGGDAGQADAGDADQAEDGPDASDGGGEAGGDAADVPAGGPDADEAGEGVPSDAAGDAVPARVSQGCSCSTAGAGGDGLGGLLGVVIAAGLVRRRCRRSLQYM